jgi:nuclear GTP-binding protein
MLNSNKAIGGENLLNLLKNYCRVEDTKKTITVGIIGFPNVGKSSIINSLKRGKVVGVSSTPGYTKSMQEIILDRNIKLLDCPGVVFSNNNTESTTLHNVIRIEDIKDPVEVVNLILKKVTRQTLAEIYELPQLRIEQLETEKLLYFIGDKFKKYKKGGIVDLDKTARLIVKDWNDGKLKYFSVPENFEKIEGFTLNDIQID